MDSRIPVDQETLQAWMANYILSVLDLPAAQIRTDQTFDTYGFDSVEAVVMAGVMEEEFGVPVDPIQLFEHPTIEDFARTYGRDAGEAEAGDRYVKIQPGEIG
jgi:acyl carrier protein